MIVCRDTLTPELRVRLSEKLRKITGWQQLKFDEDGALNFGETISTTGSQKARELLEQASDGPAVVVLEDASNRTDVAFSRVNPGRWKTESNTRPVYVVLIDFADFNQLTGNEPALQAFNEGWALLHELDHVVHDSFDGADFDDLGESEIRINQMRKECKLPQRTKYFFTPYPNSHNGDFKTAYVRLPFELVAKNGKKKRYWLAWDSTNVGLGMNATAPQ